MTRGLVVVVALALASLHCSAPVDGVEGVEDGDWAGGDRGAGYTDDGDANEGDAETRRVRAASVAGLLGPMSRESTHRPLSPALAPLVRDGADTVVTSTVRDNDGALYATGTFIGEIAMGRRILRSKGGRDVFLVKVARLGPIEWARALGSVSAESAPRVSISDGRVSVVAMTKGDVDCGKGPMPVWSGETFFLCTFGREDGAPIAGGSFPTGRP